MVLKFFVNTIAIPHAKKQLFFMQVSENETFGYRLPWPFLPRHIVSRNNQLQITFRANSNSQGRGFLISFRAGEIKMLQNFDGRSSTIINLIFKLSTYQKVI